MQPNVLGQYAKNELVDMIRVLSGLYLSKNQTIKMLSRQWAEPISVGTANGRFYNDLVEVELDRLYSLELNSEYKKSIPKWIWEAQNKDMAMDNVAKTIEFAAHFAGVKR